MDKDKGIHDTYGVEPGKCEALKEGQGDCKKVDKETDKEVPYNENTRYYWF